MTGNKVKIIVAAHKKYRMPEDSMYLPVQVGAKGKADIGFQRDDEGENISELNPYFCELTGLYWAWKNLDVDYIGLAHYRRHFSLHPHVKNPWEGILRYDEIKSDLGKIKVFVPNKRKYYIETLYSHYEHTHYGFQLDEARKVIEEKYPDYVNSFDKAVYRRWGYMFNMMIMEKEYFNEYCLWLFDILFELRSRLGEKGLSPFHSRYYGRISEIIFNVWLLEKNAKREIKKGQLMEIPMIYTEKVNWLKKGTAFLGAKFLGKKYSGSF